MKKTTELELKFFVPQAARAAVIAELERGSATLERSSLHALYLDTPDRRLAEAGMAWRLRREGRRWIQTLKSSSSDARGRHEHEAILARPIADPAAHAGTRIGDQLIEILKRARADGIEPVTRFRAEVRRTTRRIRSRGAVVEVALDDGRMLAGGSSQRIREVEFALVSGSFPPMLALVERWRQRFRLLYDPQGRLDRGDRLAEGAMFPPVRKAGRPIYPNQATATEAFGVVLDDCLAQIAHNAIALIAGDPSQRVEHVHQLRVGIRRLRSALRCFQGWVQAPTAELITGLRALFAELGRSRDRDVLDSGVLADLAKAGAPPLPVPPGAGPDPAKTTGSDRAQQLLLAWIAWRVTLVPLVPDIAPDGRLSLPPGEAATSRSDDPKKDETTSEGQAPASDLGLGSTVEKADHASAHTFARNARRRLHRWHERIVSDWKVFDDLDDAGLHALRKRIKRQRYAVEFFAPVLRRRQVENYLQALTAIQERMGVLNDLFVARATYQGFESAQPAVWFALGWLSARIAETRGLAKPELARLAKRNPPSA